MTKTEYRAVIWGNTVKAVAEYPQQFTRTEHTHVQRKFEDNLHAIMHRAGEQQDELFQEVIMKSVRYFELLEQYRLAETDEQKRLILAEIEREQGGENRQLLTED